MRLNGCARLVAAGLLVAATTVASTSSAVAEGIVLHDERGDVAEFASDNGDLAAAPGLRHPDVLRVRFAHGASHLKVRARFDKIARAGESFTAAITVDTPSRRFVFTAVALTGSRAEVVLPNNVDQSCEASVRIDYDSDRLRMVVPRSCFGSPDWVRLRFLAWVDQADGDVLYDAASRGVIAPEYRPGPFSERLFRG